VPLLIHLAWRQGFYGELLPNTWRVKEGPLSLTLPLGIHYVASFIRSYGLVFLPILVAIGALRIRQPGLRHHYLSLLGLVAGFSCYVAMMGGDHFAFYRFLVPLWAPSMLLLATCGDALLLDRTPRNSWLIQPMSLVFASYVLWPPAGELRHASEARDNVDRWAFVGQELRKEVPRETVIALSPVGALPYYSRLKTLDILGLTDKHIASLPPDPSIGYVGHLKHDGCYILRAQPDLLLLDNVRLADGPVSRFPLEGLSPMERDIPTCPEFQQYQLINKPLTGARFPGDFGVVYLVAYARRGSPLAREFGAEDDRPAGTP
jgi:hypothetical protein